MRAFAGSFTVGGLSSVIAMPLQSYVIIYTSAILYASIYSRHEFFADVISILSFSSLLTNAIVAHFV